MTFGRPENLEGTHARVDLHCALGLNIGGGRPGRSFVLQTSSPSCQEASIAQEGESCDEERDVASCAPESGNAGKSAAHGALGCRHRRWCVA
jgi:hypothetical protein